MPDWTSADVVAGAVKLHYYRTGADRPALLLCHGVTDDGLCWTPVARALEDDYDVIMPDARGHGLSDAPAAGYSPEALAADLGALVDALGLRRPALGGHSMGALTVLHLAAARPDLPRAIVLEDPPLDERERKSPHERAASEAQVREWIGGLQRQSRAQIVEAVRRDNPAWPAGDIEPWAGSKLRVRRFDFMGRSAGTPWRALLPRVTCPALLITGDPERGALVTPPEAEEAQRLLPHLQVVRLRGAGHSIRRERFDEYVRAVREFLKNS